MAIEWVPLFSAPWHRRCELFLVALPLFIVILGCILSVVIIYFLIAGNIYMRILCTLYIAFSFYDLKMVADQGGRGAGWKWLRNLKFWRHFINYFPIDLVISVNLPADRNYLIAIFPHGMYCNGAIGNFAKTQSKWSILCPGIRAKIATLTFNHCFPFARELFSSFGMCTASEKSLTKLLSQSNDPNNKSNRDGYTANGVVLSDGGEREQRATIPTQYKFVLKNRKGFVRVAIKTGSTLVPAISFGENETYNLVKHKPGTILYNIQKTIKRWTGADVLYINGRGLLQYNFGLLPHRRPITTVLGIPIDTTKNETPSAEEIDEVHALFCKSITEMFETHKRKYRADWEDLHLELI